MLTTLNSFLPVLNVVLTICLAAGGFFALRSGNARQASEIQEKVIEALKTQNEAQERQIQTCEKEITRLKRVVSTIQLALKRRGLRIEIEGDSISIIDSQSKGTRTTTMKIIQVDKTEDEDMDIEEKETP